MAIGCGVTRRRWLGYNYRGRVINPKEEGTLLIARVGGAGNEVGIPQFPRVSFSPISTAGRLFAPKEQVYPSALPKATEAGATRCLVSRDPFRGLSSPQTAQSSKLGFVLIDKPSSRFRSGECVESGYICSEVLRLFGSCANARSELEFWSTLILTPTSVTMSNSTVELTAPNGRKYAQPTGLFINNEFVASKRGDKFPSINPA